MTNSLKELWGMSSWIRLHLSYRMRSVKTMQAKTCCLFPGHRSWNTRTANICKSAKCSTNASWMKPLTFVLYYSALLAHHFHCKFSMCSLNIYQSAPMFWVGEHLTKFYSDRKPLVEECVCVSVRERESGRWQKAGKDTARNRGQHQSNKALESWSGLRAGRGTERGMWKRKRWFNKAACHISRLHAGP